MLSPRKTTWGIVGACFLAFFVVSEAQACYIDEPLANYIAPDSYYQPGGSGSYGVQWTATSTFRTNAISFKICDWTNFSADYNLWARFGEYTGGQYVYLATSSLVNDDALQDAANATACYSAALGVPFRFPVYADLTSGHTYFFKVYGTASPADNFLLKDVLDNDFNGLQNETAQTGSSPWFSLEYDDCAYDDDVEVIENPDNDPDLIVSVESEEAIDIAKYKECIIGEDCYWKFGYNSSYDDGTFYLIYDQEPRSRAYALDTVALGSKIIRSDRFEVPAATSTGIVDFCVFLENADAELELICGLQVKWYDEYESAALAMQECVSTACDDVATSSAWWDIDFQGAIECGFRKTTCWLTTPSGAAKIRYREITGSSGQPGEVEQNFPLSVIAQFRSLFTAASVATTSTSTQYFAPIRVYDPSTGGMRTLAYMFNNKMLENGMGQYYDFYYDWATKILWLLFALYMFNRIYQVINPSAGSLFDLVLPGRKNEEASFDQVAHINPIDLRKKYPKSNLTIDLRKKRF